MRDRKKFLLKRSSSGWSTGESAGFRPPGQGKFPGFSFHEWENDEQKASTAHSRQLAGTAFGVGYGTERAEPEVAEASRRSQGANPSTLIGCRGYFGFLRETPSVSARN